MKNRLWLTGFLGALLLAPLAIGQDIEEEDNDDSCDAAYQQMDLQSRQLKLEQQESELKFQQAMWSLELEKKKIELERERQMCKPPLPPVPPHGCKGGQMHGVFMLLCAVINILLAIWVHKDLRKRNTGSGLWVVITLLSGFFGALVYAVTRLGDSKPGN